MTTPTTPLCLVVPCYNEAHRFDTRAFTEGLRTLPWLSLCLVDDGSQDGTRAVLDALATAWPERVEVLALPHNMGKAEAVRRGLQLACTRTPLVGFWDADLSVTLHEVPALRAPLETRPDLEWIWGIRLRALGRDITRGALRHYAGRGFATATSLLLDLPAYDTQCGAKLFRASPLLLTALSEPFRSRWIFDVELLVRARTLRAASGASTDFVWEQPLHAWHHRPGSKVRAADFFRAVMELLRIRRDRARWHRPLPVAGSGV